MFEVEMKFRVMDEAGTQRRLREWGFVPADEQEELDLYFNAPDRDFGETDEALRIRQWNGRTILTYKGPKLGERGKVRTELEVELKKGEEENAVLGQILEHLGYRPTLEVMKVRTPWKSASEGDVVVNWDKVAGLGTFLELEILTEARDAALARLQEWAARLGLGEEERRSYLQLSLEKKSVSIKPGNVSFNLALQ
jgi:adenylate cyclase class 2